jgi:hypothetical protein
MRRKRDRNITRIGRLGETEFALVTEQRLSTSDMDWKTYVTDGRRNLDITSRDLPFKLYRALPHGYGNATPEEWRPFLTLAILLDELG